MHWTSNIQFGSVHFYKWNVRIVYAIYFVFNQNKQIFFSPLLCVVGFRDDEQRKHCAPAGPFVHWLPVTQFVGYTRKQSNNNQIQNRALDHLYYQKSAHTHTQGGRNHVKSSADFKLAHNGNYKMIQINTIRYLVAMFALWAECSSLRLVLSKMPSFYRKWKLAGCNCSWSSCRCCAAVVVDVAIQSDQNHHVTYTALIKFRPINFCKRYKSYMQQRQTEC